MKTTRPGKAEHPKLYQHFKDAREIANVINRSRSYVFKALKDGFTDHEKEMLKAAANCPELFEKGAA